MLNINMAWYFLHMGCTMAGIITVIIILIISILITRVASIALTHTGLSRESSKFQARSAYTGVGFTTSESEKVVNHPVRRRILQLLMILGNAGIVGGIASLIIGFTDITEGISAWAKAGILVAGIAILWMLANSSWVDQRLSRIINKVLKKYSTMDVHDYASLLHLSGEYRISELAIDRDHWLVNRKIMYTGLRDEGLNILAITRQDGTYLGTPEGKTRIREGDTLILYGRDKAFEKIEKRMKGRSGNREHEEMVKEQKEVVKNQQKEDSERNLKEKARS